MRNTLQCVFASIELSLLLSGNCVLSSFGSENHIKNLCGLENTTPFRIKWLRHFSGAVAVGLKGSLMVQVAMWTVAAHTWAVTSSMSDVTSSMHDV